jgi:anti-sigma B factor antagonist
MPLHATQREAEGVIILDLDGRLTLGPETATLDSETDSLLSQKNNRLILNLKQLGTIDSTGLGLLVNSKSKFQNAGGDLKLLHLSSRHLDLLVLTRLTALFQLFDDEQAAIDSFFPERAVRRFDILEFVKSQRSDTKQEKQDESDEGLGSDGSSEHTGTSRS